MDKIFSVDEFSDQFWSPPPPPPPDHPPAEEDPKLNRSHSEWAFQMFLQEAATTSLSDSNSPLKPVGEDEVVEIKGLQHQKSSPGYYHQARHQGLNRISDAPSQVDCSQPKLAPPPVAAATPFNTIESDKQQEFLKSRLNLACAAVALTRAPFVVGQSSSGAVESTSQGSADSQSVTEAAGEGLQEKDADLLVKAPRLPAMPKKIAAQIKPAMSGSSRELSDDDEAEGENDTTESTDPTDTRRVRRMLSNRESARRSRSRKQAHLTELETQVSQVRVENSTLLKRLTDINQKYSEAAVDNRVLKADIETLRAKAELQKVGISQGLLSASLESGVPLATISLSVETGRVGYRIYHISLAGGLISHSLPVSWDKGMVKMAEETVKRVTGMNPLLQAMSEMSRMSIPAYTGSPSVSAETAVPVHENPRQQYYDPIAPSGLVPAPRLGVETGVAPALPSSGSMLPNSSPSMVGNGIHKMEGPSSVQREGRLKHP